MNDKRKIAIIIPAYKPNYLAKTLDSLVRQTNQGFHVYIGDDCSPSDLYEIVKPYLSQLDIKYKRFEQNVGGKDLVAHWNRCLGLIKDEEWFVMFSDDDLLDSCCIENFYKALKTTVADVYHFNLRFIDEKGNTIKETLEYPERLSVIDYFDQLYSGKIDARMPEFVFRRKHFLESGGFVPFELAMRTDNATVIQSAFEKDIYTISEGKVSWRISGMNVSAGGESREKHTAYYRALVSFFNWLDEFLKKKSIPHKWNKQKKITYLFNQGYNARRIIGLDTVFSVLKAYNEYPKSATSLVAMTFKIVWSKVKKKF